MEDVRSTVDVEKVEIFLGSGFLPVEVPMTDYHCMHW